MAHFAQLDENNVVIQVIVVHNNELISPDGSESELKGIEFCKSLFGQETRWLQTSYNSNFRKNYAGIGSTYRQDIDAFVYKQPYPSWILNNETAQWEAPVSRPVDGKEYEWNENLLSWVEVFEPV
jgi:hypothetical protein